MIRNKIGPFGLRPTVQKLFKNSLISSVAYLASSAFKMRQNQKNLQQEFDLAVIGGGSGGLATAF